MSNLKENKKKTKTMQTRCGRVGNGKDSVLSCDGARAFCTTTSALRQLTFYPSTPTGHVHMHGKLSHVGLMASIPVEVVNGVVNGLGLRQSLSSAGSFL